ncbi:MAG: NAD(P)H-binding protein [Bacteroidia bacterium]
MYNILVFGAIGTLGKSLIDHALNNKKIKTVRALIGKDTRKLKSFNLEKAVVDFNNENEIAQAMQNIDYVFLCMGSNYSKDEYTDDELDYFLPLKIAKIAKQAGIKSIIMVNTPFADASSNNIYIKNRGLLQQAIIDLKFFSTSVLQANHIKKSKSADTFLRVIGSNLLNLITAGEWHKRRAINVNYVSRAMIKAALKNAEGVEIYSPHTIKVM